MFNLMTKRTDFIEVRVTVKMVYPVLIKVRAYTRVRFGKVEKVRSHYRLNPWILINEFHDPTEVIPQVQHFDTYGSTQNQALTKKFASAFSFTEAEFVYSL